MSSLIKYNFLCLLILFILLTGCELGAISSNKVKEEKFTTYLPIIYEAYYYPLIVHIPIIFNAYNPILETNLKGQSPNNFKTLGAQFLKPLMEFVNKYVVLLRRGFEIVPSLDLVDGTTTLFYISFFYAGIIFFRGIQFGLATIGVLGADSSKLTTIIVVILLVALAGSRRLDVKISPVISLLMVTYIISAMMLIYSGIASGSQMSSGKFFSAIPGILLLIGTVSIGFLEPILGATITTICAGLNVFQNYSDRYSVIRTSFRDNYILNYVFVWPPLILLFTFTDIYLLPMVFGKIIIMIITFIFVFLGFLMGFLIG